MKKILKNNKGFTLVELLAVIVVLAVIILVAMPAVMSSMEKARKNAFSVEANEVIRIAQTAYADALMANMVSGNTVCIDYDYLKNGFIDKNDTSYQGSIKISVDPTTGTASYTLWLSNKNYSITGGTGDITAASIDKDRVNGGASKVCGDYGHADLPIQSAS